MYHAHPAHPPPLRRHRHPVILFVTVSLQRPSPLRLTDGAWVTSMVTAWRQADQWRVGFYLVMPDHVHWFCAPGVEEAPPVRRWTGYWKRLLGEREPRLRSVFQSDCWDTQMRDRAHYEERLDYVRRNPVRQNLVARAEDWPHCGRVFDLQGW